MNNTCEQIQTFTVGMSVERCCLQPEGEMVYFDGFCGNKLVFFTTEEPKEADTCLMWMTLKL